MECDLGVCVAVKKLAVSLGESLTTSAKEPILPLVIGYVLFDTCW